MKACMKNVAWELDPIEWSGVLCNGMGKKKYFAVVWSSFKNEE